MNTNRTHHRPKVFSFTAVALAAILAFTATSANAQIIPQTGRPPATGPQAEPPRENETGIMASVRRWLRGTHATPAPTAPTNSPANPWSQAQPQVRSVPAATDPETQRRLQETEAEFRRLTVSMTRQASEGAYPDFSGRTTDLARLQETMLRVNRGAVFVIGDGRVELLQALAARRADEIVALNPNNLIGDTQNQGMLERRIQSLIDALKLRPNTLVYIDQAQIIATEPNLARTLLTAFASGEIRALLGVSQQDYNQHFDRRHPDFVRNAARLQIEPFSDAEVLRVLRSRRVALEEHYRAKLRDASPQARAAVRLSDDSIREALRLTKLYYSSSSLTQRSLDILESGLARFVSERNDGPLAQMRAQDNAMQAREEWNSLTRDLHALQEGDPRRAELTERVRAARNVFHDAIIVARQRGPGTSLGQDHVSPRVLQQVVALETGESLERIQRSDEEILRTFRRDLGTRVLGQDQAIGAIATHVEIARLNLAPQARPISVLLSGPTGVGKTELAKASGDLLYGRAAFLRFDMSEFMEKHSVARLIGAPPGYEGHAEGGEMTNAVAARGQRVILLDEIEKAHQDVFNILLQVLDDGRLTDGQGRTVDFRNVIIVMTTNLGQEYTRERATMTRAEIEAKYGFRPGEIASLDQATFDRSILARIFVRAGYRPELVNRLTEVVPMNALTLDSATVIAKHRLDEIARHNRVENRRIITYDAGLPEAIARAGFDFENGARPIDRATRTLTLETISRAIIDGGLERNGAVHLSWVAEGTEGGKIVARAGSATGASVRERNVVFRTHVGEDGIAPIAQETERALRSGIEAWRRANPDGPRNVHPTSPVPTEFAAPPPTAGTGGIRTAPGVRR